MPASRSWRSEMSSVYDSLEPSGVNVISALVRPPALQRAERRRWQRWRGGERRGAGEQGADLLTASRSAWSEVMASISMRFDEML